MKIVSRSPRGEIIYWLVVSLIPIGLGLWFLYDWQVGYVGQNRAKARQHPSLAGQPELVERAMERATPTDTQFRDFASTRPTSREQVVQRFGEPLTSQSRETGELVDEYPSRYGVLTVVSRGGRLPAEGGLTWIDWPHTEGQIRGQLYWTIPCAVFLIWPLRRLILALTLRVELDEDRLAYRGEVVRYDDMTGLRDYNPKGWVDLYYRKAGQSNEAMLRLDNQKVAAFNEIVTEIATRKGFANPLTRTEEQEPPTNEVGASG
ncbi:MAG TPA: hypothetical protein PKC49_03645 [Phycisphaerae bacterium]|nr:hypothetical protein [Phycisphaerae bacterium]